MRRKSMTDARTYHKIFCLLLISYFVIVKLAFAGIENRPLSTSEATLLEKGKFSIASGAEFLRQPDYDKELNWPTDFECGIYDNLELDVEIPYHYINFKDRETKDSDGLGDVAAWLGFNPIKETSICPVMSVALNIKTQSGNWKKELGTGGTDYQILLLLSKTLGSVTALVNAGYTVVGDSPETNYRDTFSYNFALKYDVVKNWTIVGEIYGRTNPDKNAARDPWDMLGGFIYNVTNRLAIDFGIGTGLTSASPDLRMTAGITYTF